MLVPPVAQSGTGDRPVGDTGARAQQTSGPAAAATLWPLAPAQTNQVPSQQSQGIPPLAATPAPAHNQGNFLILFLFTRDYRNTGSNVHSLFKLAKTRAMEI